MNTTDTGNREAQPDLRLAAERIVSQALDRQVRLTSMVCLTEPDRRSEVYRCMSEDGSTFIAKKSPDYTPASLAEWENAPWETQTFFSDWIGTEFLSGIQVEQPISPRFYGGDMQAGIFMMEDLGEHRSLVQPLLDGEDAAAEAALLRYSASVGRLHAVTVGRFGALEALYASRLPGIRPMTFEQSELGARIRNVRVQLDRLGLEVSSALDAEIKGIEEAVACPGIFLAYIHADPCPDNVFAQGDHFLLIDFEVGHFGHALIDAVYPRMIWPSCWCANRLPREIVKRMESRYRSELIAGIPEAGEDALWEAALT